MPFTFKIPDPETAKEIYDKLIARIKAKVNSEYQRVYDPNTGLQKTFLHGKLIAIKQLRKID